MKKKLLMFLVAIVTGIFCITAVACQNQNNEGNNGGDLDDAITVVLDKTELTLDLLAREELTAQVKDGAGNVVTGTVEWSSDNGAVATVSGGVVTAVSAGNAQITASYGKASAVCSVTVEANGLRPQLQLGVSSFDLKVGEANKINPSVRFKSSVLDNAEYSITYEYESDSDEVAAVSADGTVTAKKYGTANITVTAHWAEATAAGLDQGLTGKVIVNVAPPYELTLGLKDGFGENIYLTDITDGETAYHDYVLLNVEKAIYNNAEITDGLEFKSSDEEVVTVDSEGKVTLASTAKEGDTAEVWVEYSTESEGVLASEKITLTVTKAVIAKTLEAEQVIDISKATALPVSEIFGDAEAKILAVYDAEDTAKLNIYDKSENAYKDVTLLGDRKWVVVGEKISYQIDVLAVSKVISTAEDFAIFDDTTASSKPVFDGYYILGNNVDVSSLTFKSKGYPTNQGNGLTGTFDGRGYTVNGLKLASGGLFSVVASTGAIKNVAFTNVSVNAGSSGLGLVFGWYFNGSMSNVYVGINEWSTEGTGASAAIGLFAACAQKSAFNKIVVVNSAQTKYGQTVASSQQYGALAANTNWGAWQNTVVISSIRSFGGAKTFGDEGAYSKSLQRFESFGEMLESEYYDLQKGSFGKTYWNRDTLTFKSSAEYFTAELNALPESYEIAVGNSVSVAKNANAYKVELSSNAAEAGITYENGMLTATKAVSEGVSVTVTLTFGETVKVIPITVNNAITLENFTYTYNLADGDDFVITNDLFADGATSASLTVTGTDGQEITMQAIAADGAFTVSKTEFTGKIPSGSVTLSISLDGVKYGLNGVTFIYAINNVDEFLAITEHLPLLGVTTVGNKQVNKYGGNVALKQDIDMAGKTLGVLSSVIFEGVFDGEKHVINNASVSATTSGTICGTNNGTIKNLLFKNASVSVYAGVICYENNGTIENCYVQGSIPADTPTASPDNFGTGLIAGKHRNGSHVKNCIVELISKGSTLCMSGAFGKLGDGSASEAKIFENCYAVSAEKFALMTYGANRTTKNFDDNNGNKNFATIFDLFADETAAELATSLGLSAPVISRVTLSQETITLTIDGTQTVIATAYTADDVAVKAPFVWTSANENAATVENGVIKGVAAGTAVITATFGELSAQCTVTVSDLKLDDLVLENFTYAYNGTEDFTVTGTFPQATTVTAKILGLDGNYIELTGITVEEGTLTIPAAQFNNAKMPTKSVEMTLYFDNVPMKVQGAYLIYTVNTVDEYISSMVQHLSLDGSTYDGSILIGANLDFTGKSFANATVFPLWRKTFAGEIDGGKHVLSNINMAGAQTGIVGGTLTGTVKNLVVVNATVSTQGGIICYVNSGTISNCYIKGSITGDGLNATTSKTANFGTGLIVGKMTTATAKIEYCIVEVVSHGEVYNGENGDTAKIFGASAFGMMGGKCNQNNYTNCYAINADNFTVYTGSNTPGVVVNYSNFTGSSNGNFATLAELFENAAAAELAQSLGLTAPETVE